MLVKSFYEEHKDLFVLDFNRSLDELKNKINTLQSHGDLYLLFKAIIIMKMYGITTIDDLDKLYNTSKIEKTKTIFKDMVSKEISDSGISKFDIGNETTEELLEIFYKKEIGIELGELEKLLV